MYRLLLVLSVVLGGQAQAPLRLAWDYPDSGIGGITAFEVRLDGAPAWTPVGVPAPETLPTTQPGQHTYSWALPPLGNGNHTAGVRACNQTECSLEATIPFRLVGPPENVRIIR